MVASYMKKKSKLTYAERVIGALSQIQREHKKHAVHTATLRAQIRKNAQDNKDKLGPQWSNWVSRALTKLEDQGVLVPAGTGNVTFSADAKKDLTAGRRESQAHPTLSQAGGYAPEELIWKQVAQADYTRGVKRQRRRSSAAQVRYEGEEDEEEMQPQSASISTRRRSTGVQKRARRQSSGKALSKMTKAELQAELRNAQAKQADPVITARLQDELDETRKQLAEAQEQLSSPARGNVMGSQPRTPEPTSASVPQTVAHHTARRGLLFGITRTESGSIINQYSKQPTPAPSSPGGHDFDMEDDLPPSAFGDVFTGPHGLATPSSSIPYKDHGHSRPSPPEADEMNHDIGSPLTPLQTERELEAEDENSTHIRRLAELQDQLREKSEQLSSKDATLASQQDRVLALEQAVADLEASCADKDTTVIGVRSLLRDSEALASTLRSDLVAQQGRHDTEFGELRGSIASYQTDLELAKKTHATALQELETERAAAATLAQEKIALQESYDTVQAAVTSLRAELEGSHVSVEGLTTRCVDLEARLVQADLHRAELTERLETLQSELHDVSTARTDISLEMEIAKGQLVDANATLTSLREELSTATQELVLGKTTAAALEVQIASLQELRTSDVATLEDLRNKAVNFETKADSLQNDLEDAMARVADLSSQVQDGQAREAELEKARAEALQQQKTLDTKLTYARNRVSELELTSDELAHRLQVREGELSSVRTDLQEKVSQASVLQADLLSTQEAYKRLEQTLSEKTEALETLHSQVTSLTTTETDLRKALELQSGQHVAEKAEFVSQISHLKSSVESLKTQVEASAVAVEDAHSAREAIDIELKAAQAHLESGRGDLVSAQDQISSLTRTIDDAHLQATRAAKEIEQLRLAREQDEKNILKMQEIFSGLRESQMKSLNEAEARWRRSSLFL
ncbi:hypothetical protein EIP91_002747 [Steccherinum ochraceum]|uniref:Uncharacterized protein n=1 Tax=Steccherinum ochraceum TaxID=92696 RepID=A0A4R0RF86_9APHY|nr:hypothetical protein EIP91_002747 [Steccherinum ochraceum]